MLNFENRTGPLLNDAPTYPEREIPLWFRDAKLGFFIHWGIYSVPAWATSLAPPTSSPRDAYAYHQYAEWYANTLRISGSPTQRWHEEHYGVGTSYEDLARLWKPDEFDPSTLVDTLVGAGGRYLIPTTKHHDGFCLWDTATTSFTSVQRGPRRDLVRELHDAARTAGLRFGVYFSGALDWHASGFGPIESDHELFENRRNDERFARYASSQLEELIDAFHPDVVWNDIDWPDAGKGTEPWALAGLLSRYYDQVPDGVVNDRWGIPFHGFVTREYSHVPDTMSSYWEATRGTGLSFGWNRNESEERLLTADALIRFLVDVVSKNGNLLLNIGPNAAGHIPVAQEKLLGALGEWLSTNGEAIYATRTWQRFGDEERHTRFTVASDGEVYVHALEPSVGVVQIPTELVGRRVRWLGADGSSEARADSSLMIPDRLRRSSVAVAGFMP